jgi:hypothetical protein
MKITMLNFLSKNSQRKIRQVLRGEILNQLLSLYDGLKDGRSSHWGPFENEEEWGLAEWLIRNVGQKQTDTFLKLPIV